MVLGGLIVESAPTVETSPPRTRARSRRATGATLDVVIVSYRCQGYLRRCLKSLESHAPAGTNVCIVDNDSRDGTVEMVRAEFPEVDVIENATNLGFARATNLGIRRGMSPYVLVLNPDTQIFRGTLDCLLSVLEEKPEVAAVGPRLVRPDGSFDHAARRSFPTLLGALGHFTGVGRLVNRGSLAQYRAPQVERGPLDAINGAFMLIRRDALEQVGLFDEGYWMYMEDLDLCYRFAQAGWRSWYAPEATVTHAKGGSAGRHRSARLTIAFHYGMFRFYRKHYARTRSILTNAAVYLGIGLKVTLALLASVLHPPGGRRRSR